MAQVTLKNVTLKIKDGTTTPNTLTVAIGEGNFQWSERRNMEYTLNGGSIDEVREGDDVPMEVNFDATLDYVMGDTGSGETVSIADALRKENSASNWTSTDSDACRPYAVDLEITNNPGASCGDTETLTFSDFRMEDISYDLRNGSVSVSGRCNAVKATSSRA